MKRLLLIVALINTPLPCQGVACGQEPDIAALTKELEILKRENERLKQENELLKQELAATKKGSAKAPSETNENSPLSVTVDDVEYVYQGMQRNGPELLVTLLATSKRGEHPAPHGFMKLVDDEGNSYSGKRVAGEGVPRLLREGIATKLTWRFAPNALNKAGSAPSATISRFASLSVGIARGGRENAIEFRDVPATGTKRKKD